MLKEYFMHIEYSKIKKNSLTFPQIQLLSITLLHLYYISNTFDYKIWF